MLQIISLPAPLQSCVAYIKFIYGSMNGSIPLFILCTFGILGVIVEKAQATTEDLNSNEVLDKIPESNQRIETADKFPSLVVDAEVVQDIEPLNISFHSPVSTENPIPALESLQVEVNLSDFWKQPQNVFTAAPENFNPELTLPPPEPVTPSPSPSDEVETETPKDPFSFPFDIESLNTNFKRDSDNFDQLNQFFEPTAYFRLPNDDLLSLQTGYNLFQQDEIEDISNVPLRIGWERKTETTTVSAILGLDWFNRLPTTPYFYGKAESPIFAKVSSTGELESLLVISGEVEYSPYKFNARTLDHEISALRFGPNLFWQMNRKTSFFTTARYGNYNDGNQELLSFSRLERKEGSFSIAANLFTWNYEDDLEQESGYFSPPDFLVYTGEIAWQEELTNFLRCRVAATLGQQRLNGEWDLANSYQALCTTKLSRQIELDLGYTFSNVQNRETEESVYNNHSIQGQLRVQF